MATDCEGRVARFMPGCLRPQRPTSGDVVGVGEGNTVTGKKEMTLKEGDTVLYGRFGIGCTDLKMGDGDYVLIREDDIIGKMPRPGASASDIPEMTPMGTRVLVRVTEESSVTVGGVLLPDAAKEKPVMGEVHAVGPGTKVRARAGRGRSRIPRLAKMRASRRRTSFRLCLRRDWGHEALGHHECWCCCFKSR